jgi:hypothetical protein
MYAKQARRGLPCRDMLLYAQAEAPGAVPYPAPHPILEEERQQNSKPPHGWIGGLWGFQ